MKKLFYVISSKLGTWGLIKNISLGVISGLSSFMFIQSVNKVLARMLSGDYSNVVQYSILFATIILVFVWARRILSHTIIRLSQSLFWDLRKQIISILIKANYEDIAAKKNDINTAIVNDINALTQASWFAIDFFIAIILAFSCLVYLATISVILFLITFATVLAGITVYSLNAKKNVVRFKKALELENKFLLNFNAIVSGFKEIFIAPIKGWAIYKNNIEPVAKASYARNTTAHFGMLNNQITGQILFYMLISSVLLYFSHALNIEPDQTMGFVFTLLYLLGAIVNIMSLLSIFMTASVAYNHMVDLRDSLSTVDQSASTVDQPAQKFLRRDQFEKIFIHDLEFQYGKSTVGFSIGPVDLMIEKGDTIFIYGGNGSGKTTLINCLLGLYMPTKGQISINNILVTKEKYSEFKAIFSVIFSDFYLFEELFGIDQVNEKKWNHYLTLFEMENKVHLDGKRFSTTNLSTAQRKRLALIASLLEEKPILVLDEWAADQDPYFRKKFYTEIIPTLKKEGITIIAITHDDRYYHIADKLYRMDEGRLVKENERIKSAPSFF